MDLRQISSSKFKQNELKKNKISFPDYVTDRRARRSMVTEEAEKKVKISKIAGKDSSSQIEPSIFGSVKFSPRLFYYFFFSLLLEMHGRVLVRGKKSQQDHYFNSSWCRSQSTVLVKGTIYTKVTDNVVQHQILRYDLPREFKDRK